MQPEIPIIHAQLVRSWPNHPLAPRCQYVPLSRALTVEFSHDAHTTQYCVPLKPHRLGSDALGHPDVQCVAMQMFIADVDGPGHICEPKWWSIEKVKIGNLFKKHPGGFVYQTRGGYRIIYQLPEPILLYTAEDADRWKQLYLLWAENVLHRGHAILNVDKGCNYWACMYRLPHATRDDNAEPERRETIGDPEWVGYWSTPYKFEDVKPIERRAVKSIGDYEGNGLLYHLFLNRGMLGPEIKEGCWAVRCPWEEGHSKKSKPFDGATIILAPREGKPGGTNGNFFCNHTSCKGKRKLKDLIG